MTRAMTCRVRLRGQTSISFLFASYLAPEQRKKWCPLSTTRFAFQSFLEVRGFAICMAPSVPFVRAPAFATAAYLRPTGLTIITSPGLWIQGHEEQLGTLT